MTESKNPKRIYLTPACDGYPERTWCVDDDGPCSDCGAPWIAYDIVEPLPAGSGLKAALDALADHASSSPDFVDINDPSGQTTGRLRRT